MALFFPCQAMYEKRRRDLDRAELAAARLLSPLKALDDHVASLFAWLVFYDGDSERTDAQILKLLDELHSISASITMDDLYQLLGLPDHAAKRAARALGLIQTFRHEKVYRLSGQSWREASAPQKAAAYDRWGDDVMEFRDHLIIAVRICESAASTGAPRPSTFEIHGSDEV
ncbi:hypothetical protein G7011_00425 [Pseudomonas plecoglossicida]|uniref:hypothetical protein n=1 Tax=Pseudomonas plecoglossicida TaxID=70775 RepID=UPI0015E41471|nr:hypothetical protein [Pseudomonas plecoglossicida]MBA1195578.1 hypothetical protein [Pseudomonas plecoglossicida]